MDSIETKYFIIAFIPTVLACMANICLDIEMLFVKISSLMPVQLLADYYSLLA